MAEKRTRNKPVHVGRSGNVRVPVYCYAARSANGKTSAKRYCVAYRKVDGEPPNRETFTVKKEAIDRADEMAIAIANGQAQVIELSSTDRDSYRLARQICDPLGVPIHVALEEWASARAIIRGHSLNEAVNFFNTGRVTKATCRPTGEILAALLVRMRDERLSEKYVDGFESDLAPFARSFPDLSQATEEDLRTYLSNLQTKPTKNHPSRPVSARRRDNVRDKIVTTFFFAKEKGDLPGDVECVAEKIGRVDEGADITTYTPAELALLLEHVSHDWLPWLAISAFAGLRTSEIFRLDWSRVNWETGVIAVGRVIAKKVKISRRPPISENLRAWLRPWRDAVGPIYPAPSWVNYNGKPLSWRAIEDRHSRELERLRKATGIETHNNACRHSFGSHRLAIVKSEHQLAIEMGTSIKMIREHYNDPKPEAEALAFFQLLPPIEAANVLPLEFADPRRRRA